MDGGLLPERPDDCCPKKCWQWRWRRLFVAPKGKLLFDCYGAIPLRHEADE